MNCPDEFDFNWFVSLATCRYILHISYIAQRKLIFPSNMSEQLFSRTFSTFCYREVFRNRCTVGFIAFFGWAHILESQERQRRDRGNPKNSGNLAFLSGRVSHRHSHLKLRRKNSTAFCSKDFSPQKAGIYTPQKINIEPENDVLEDDFPFPRVYSQVLC